MERNEPVEEGGDPACWAHVLEPVTEDALGDAVLAAVVRGTGDAVVIADPGGRITFWNAAAEALFGWSAAQAVGRTLDLIIPERQRPRHDEGFRRVMATGVTRYRDDLLRVPALHGSAERRSIAFTVTLLHDDDGRVTGIAAIIRDETARWQEEQALRAEVRSLRAAGEAPA